MPLSYVDAGVDQTKKDKAIDRILEMMRRTHDRGVIDLPWGFAGLYSLVTSPVFKKPMKHPVLVACTDSVGTKVKLAQTLGKHDTVGIDCVAMSVNDLIVTGGRPLFFLDYIGCGKADQSLVLDLARGVIEGCLQSECALLGGETAEMPGVYPPGEYDLAGFAVGVVEKSKIISGTGVKAGDDVIALASSGLHSNGYSLARKIVEGQDLAARFGASTLGRTLLAPTRIYARTIRKVLELHPVKAMANITGGGMVENIPRVIPGGCAVEIREGTWQLPPIFPFLQKMGDVPREEMYRVFNMGVGMVLVSDRRHTAALLRTLKKAGEKASLVGNVVRGHQEVKILEP
jgi:phosphoribosylformylglycinamidine cyclo-ligase